MLQKIAKEGKSALCLNYWLQQLPATPQRRIPSQQDAHAGSSMLEVSRWGAPSAENGIEAKDDYMRTGTAGSFREESTPNT